MLYVHITFQQKGLFLAHDTGQRFISFTDDNGLDRTAKTLYPNGHRQQRQ